MAVGVLIAGLVESIFTSPGSPFTILLWSGLGVAAVHGVAETTETEVLAEPPAPPSRTAIAARALVERLPRWPSTARGTLVLSAAVGLAVTGLALVPRVNARLQSASPSQYDVVLARLPGSHAGGPGVPFGVPAELESLRIAAAYLPARARYYAYAGQGAPRAALETAAHFYIPNGLPMRLPSDADWIISYRSPALVPAGVVPTRVNSVAPGILLVKVRR